MYFDRYGNQRCDRPPVAYKYATKTDAVYDLAGSWRISQLSYFRELERQGSFIPDAYEGRAMGKLVDETIYDLTDEQRENLRSNGLEIDATSVGNRFVNFTSHSQCDDCFILSLSTKSNIRAFVRDENLTEILIVPDIRLLADRIKGVLVGQVGEWAISVVEYERLIGYDPRDRSSGASPFKKDVQFEFQKEIRIAFEPLSAETYLIAKIPNELVSGLCYRLLRS